MRQLRLDDPTHRRWLRALREETLGTPAVVQQVSEILAQVRKDGDPAVLSFGQDFDGVRPNELRLSNDALAKLSSQCDPDLVRILKRAAENIRSFHLPQLPKGYVQEGGRLEQRVVALDAVGLYVPGGRAAYPSTVLMNAIPARVAGVRRICVASPPQKGVAILSPPVAAACEIAGVTDVFVMGGAQAIAAFAFGTHSVPRVQKICGPGNAWVAEAKRQVAGRVGIDMIAGPTELLVVDDGRSPPEYIAYDLLAQAEHDPLAVPWCVTTNAQTWKTLPSHLEGILSREPNVVASQSIANRGAVILANNIDEAIAFANEFAPEHLHLKADPGLVNRITTAGAVFVGDATPEPVGDYFAGPNHTLPTAGSAAFSSPLGVYDFVRRLNVIQWSDEDLKRDGPAIARFAKAEGLSGHARAVEVRLEKGAVARPDSSAETSASKTTKHSHDVAEFVIPAVRRQSAYTLTAPPSAPVKLNQNEAPEDLPAELKQLFLDELKTRDWRRYPPFDPQPLKERIAASDGWRPDGVMIGNGSNELLTLLIRSVLERGETVVRVSPCFSLYPLHLDLAGARQTVVTLQEADDFSYDLDALVEAARAAKVILLTSPNNPTGSTLTRAQVERLLGETQALVIVDEAYREWCGQDFAPLLEPGVPLVLLRTLSKAHALAGLRFGYLLAPPSVCSELNKVALPYPVNTFTGLVAGELAGRRDLMNDRVRRVQAERGRMSKLMRGKGRRVIEGGANFVLMSSADPAMDFSRLLSGGVLVRDLSQSVPGYLRISVGTSDETDRLVKLL